MSTQTEALLELNSWAREHTIDEKDEKFTSARRDASLERYLKGVEHWNAWAKEIQAVQKHLEEVKTWRTVSNWDRALAMNRDVGLNSETQDWLSLAVADFGDHIFEVSANFRGFVFPGETYFNNTNHKENAEFTGAQFHNCVRFDGTIFLADAWFRHAIFTRDCVFRNVDFQGEVRFSLAQFDTAVWFTATRFDKAAGFRRTWFSFADFQKAVFCRQVRFNDGARFGIASFDEAQFHGKVWFDMATFEGNTSFARAHFYRGPVPRDARTDDVLTRDIAPDFGGVSVLRAFSLDSATFDVLPNFIQASFAEAPRFDNITLSSRVKPRNFWQAFYYSETGITERDITARYRTLRRIAIQAHDNEREHLFFKGEVRSARNLKPDQMGAQATNSAISRSVRKLRDAGFWFGILYDMISDCGHSVFRPLVAWLGALPIFAWMYHYLAIAVNKKLHGESWESWRDSFYLSWTNEFIMSGSGVRSLNATTLYDSLFDNVVSLRIYAIECFQTIVSASLIFLLLLALRNRFRIR